MEPTTDNLIVLGIATAAWCALHSTLIGSRWTAWLEARLGERYRFYRIAFNAIALATLVPVLMLERALGGPLLVGGGPTGLVVRAGLLAAAGVLFALGAREYDMKSFLGTRQLRRGSDGKTLTASGGLHTAGILGWIRHPWYTGAMAFIWSRSLDAATLVVNVVLTVYLIVGAYLEERKLVREFGDDYRRYQREVGMFLPYRRRARAGE
jgi:protein-S-isoprenylcysteine O-methyltransferase Ste14